MKRITVISLVVISLMAGLFSFFGFPSLRAHDLKSMSAMPGQSYRGPLAPLAPEERDLAGRLRHHVAAVAAREHHVARHDELEQSAQYIEQTLASLGYDVRRQEFLAEAQKVRNIEVALPPEKSGTQRPELVVIGAHYDSAIGTPGANDNGSGVAAVLELARLLKDFKPAVNREIRLVLYVNEEMPWFGTPQMGSWVHANSLHARGEKVAAMLSLETIGYYSDARGSQKYPEPLASIYPDAGNFIAFVSNPESKPLLHAAIESFRRHAAFPSEGLAAPASVPGVDLSDHKSYWDFGYPAIMLTDTAFYRYPHYHTPQDTPDKVDYERLARVLRGVDAVVRDLAGRQ